MRRRSESGFALLFIFLMAAVVAIMLYAELPRVAFQSQRQKEQLLMERGEQYRRAIQVFYMAAKRWPATLDELDSFQNRHFLRHKYVDPMTGKAEWRVIHIQGGVLTDSVLTKKQDGEKASTGTDSNYISSYAGIGQTSTTGMQGARPQDRRRASEGGTGLSPDGQYIPGVSPMPMPGEQNQPSNAGQPNQPVPGAPGNVAGGSAVPGAPGMPGQQQPGMPGQQQPGMPGQQQPGMPGQQQPGMPGQPQQQQAQSGGSYVTALPGIGAQLPTQTGAPPSPGQPYPNPGMTGSGYSTTPGGMTAQPGQAGNAAIGMINRILTTPNPQGALIAQRASQTAGSGTLGGGIAGVASTAEMEGIMVLNDRTAYNEWEFIFDYTKVRMAPTGSSGPSGSTSASQMGSQLGGRGQFGTGPGVGPGGGRGGMGMTGAGGMGMTGTGGIGTTGAGSTGSTGTGGIGAGGVGGSGGLPANVRPGRP